MSGPSCLCPLPFLMLSSNQRFKIGKGVRQGCILSPCLFNSYAEYILQNVWLDEAQAGIKIAGRNINDLRFADDTILMAENKEELKNLLMKVKEKRKSWLKTQHSKNKDHGVWSHHFMANRWKTMETVRDFIWGLQNHGTQRLHVQLLLTWFNVSVIQDE